MLYLSQEVHISDQPYILILYLYFTLTLFTPVPSENTAQNF